MIEGVATILILEFLNTFCSPRLVNGIHVALIVDSVHDRFKDLCLPQVDPEGDLW